LGFGVGGWGLGAWPPPPNPQSPIPNPQSPYKLMNIFILILYNNNYLFE